MNKALPWLEDASIHFDVTVTRTQSVWVQVKANLKAEPEVRRESPVNTATLTVTG